MRISNPMAADVVCDDFTLSIDRMPEMSTQVHSFAAILEAMLSSRMTKQEISEDGIDYIIEGGNTFSCGVVKSFVQDYFKYSILAWWYAGRHELLHQKYILKATTVCDELKGQLVPKFYDRKVRYF
ncbi:MAG: hypothetical protein RSB23_06780 [Alistipes sp.]